MFPIADIVPEVPAFCIVDVGPAHPGTPQRWQGLLDAGVAQVFGFEAAAATCAGLNAVAPPRHTFLPLTLGDGSEQTLHVTAHPSYTSVYEPNDAYIRLLRQAPPLFTVVGTERVPTHRLDDVDVLRDPGCDYMHFDIPGAAVSALAGAPRLLEATLAVHVRVYLTPIYRDQPMLGDVDALLRRHGFVVHSHLQSGGATLDHPSLDGGPGIYLNQEIWADFVYVKDFADAGSQPAPRWVRLAVLLHELYRSYDLAHLAFAHADRLSGGNLAPRYLAAYQAAATNP
jgi:hypothetical protein